MSWAAEYTTPFDGTPYFSSTGVINENTEPLTCRSVGFAGRGKSRLLYVNGFNESKQINFLLQIIPHEQQGALETLILEAISEDEYDKNIVNKNRAYVDSIAPEAGRYIGKRRLILKAYLGVTWAIQSPQKVFSFIDDQIRMVKWEESKILAECFSQIKEI